MHRLCILFLLLLCAAQKARAEKPPAPRRPDARPAAKKPAAKPEAKPNAKPNATTDDGGDAKPAAPRDPLAHPMSLRALWDQVQRRYPGLAASQQVVRAARYALNEQRGLRLPSGELTAYVTGSPSVKCQSVRGVTDLNGSPLTGPDACLSTTAVDLAHGPIEQILPVHGVVVRVDARVVQPLFTFGKISAAIDLGQIGVNLAQAGADAGKADLALNVVRAYYGLKAARTAMDTVKEGEEQVSSWIKRIDKDLEQGKGGSTEIDLLRLKVAYSQVELGLVDVERTVKSTLAALRFLAQDIHAEVDDTPLAVEPSETRDLNYYLEQALQHRPEARQLLYTGDGARAYRRLRVAELFPDFAVVGTFGYGLATGIEDANNAFLNRANYLGASLGLVMRLTLDYGPKIARLQKAQADLLQYEARRREALGAGALEIERAYNDLTESTQRLKAAERAERRSRGWLQGVKQNIDIGTAESRDMVDALRSYFDQHILVLRTINDVNVNAASLRRLSGLPVVVD